MARMTTRSMTGRGQGLRLHLLALPAEVRAMILAIIIFNEETRITVGAHYTSKIRYWRVRFAPLCVFRLLRGEAIRQFARAPGTELLIWPHIKVDWFAVSAPQGFLDHLQRITFGDAPHVGNLEDLKKLPSLQTVIWKPMAHTGSNLRFPRWFDKIGWRKAFSDHLLTILETDYEKLFLSDSLKKEQVSSSPASNNTPTTYKGFDTRYELLLDLASYWPPDHPDECCEGFMAVHVKIDIVEWKLLDINARLFHDVDQSEDCDDSVIPWK